jgi:hypothetical protein
MTTHDDQTRTAATPEGGEAPMARPESNMGTTEAAAARIDPSADAPPAAREPLSAGDVPPSAAREPLSAGDVPPSAEREPVTAGDVPPTPTADSRPSQAVPEPASGPPTSPSLFGDTDLSGLRSRWNDVQAAFVDSPKECVQRADSLVSEVVEQLTTGFSDARSRLEAQWAKGENASTEDLRVALKRYREFFQRLLSV